MYPQDNAPGSWPQYNQQPHQQDPYQLPYPQDPYQQPYQQMPPYGYPGQPLPGYAAPGPRPRSKAPLIIGGAVLGVVVLVCALAVFIVRLGAAVGEDAGSERANPASTSQQPKTATPPPTGTGTETEESVEGDLTRFNVGDCLTITGPENTVNPASCSASGAYKVLLRRDGTTDENVCDSTDATEILYQDGAGTSRDLVLCVAAAK